MVPTGAEITIINWIIPVTPIVHALRFEFGGCNIGKYRLYFGTELKSTYITYFGAPLHGVWDFRKSNGGLSIPPNTLVKVTITHNRPFASDHYCHIHYVEIN